MKLVDIIAGMDQEVLKERANILASSALEEKDSDKVMISVFLVGKHSKFGVEANIVESILRNTQITKVPHTPKHIYGATYFQGEIITVIDTSAFFDIDKKNDNFEYKIVLNYKGQKIAILADEILDLENLDKDTLSTSDILVDRHAADYAFGIYKGEVVMLNAVKLIKSEQLILEAGND